MNPMSAAHILVRPDLSVAMVEEWARQADILPRDFYSADEVVEILSAAGYALTAETISEFTRKNYITLPPSDRWPVIAVHQLAVSLEQRRHWQLSPSCHDDKKSKAELVAERNPDEVIEAAKTVTLEDLLLLLFQSDGPEERGYLHLLARAKMCLLEIKE